MAKPINLRLNEEEETLVINDMIQSGETKIGTQIKKVYFEKIAYSELVLELKEELDQVNIKLESLRKIIEDKDDELMLTMLSGLYVMMRSSSSEKVRTEADKYINVATIENYLKD